jgi:uncharacterized protein (TIGR04222 family)
MDAPYRWVTGGLLIVAMAVLFPPFVPSRAKFWPTEVGFLRGGTRSAVQTALAGLHANGLITVRARGGVRQT